MAEESHLERTEPASPRRLEQARAEGQVARSPELTTCAIVTAGAVALWFYGGVLAGELQTLTRGALGFEPELAFDSTALLGLLHAQALHGLLVFLPLGLLVLAAALAAPLLVGGWAFSPGVMQPDFSRLDPIGGLQRIFSLHSLVDLARSLLKAALVTAAAIWAGWLVADDVMALAGLPLRPALAHTATLVGLAFLALAAAIAIVAAIDVPYQLWNFHRKLRMTRDEARRELKETEGDPHLKARVRALQREAARRRMMARVPTADVVVTNPSHYAVALQYREDEMRAPRVVARGAFLVAERIRALAEANGVPILEAPSLARALYRHAELDREIPALLYTAVAEVLAYVYQLRRARAEGRVAPQQPDHIEVPPGLDPGPHAS